MSTKTAGQPVRELPEGAPPFVSVIVPVYNDAGGLRACLAALSRQTYAPDRFEVVVVDNGSRRKPEDVVRAFSGARLEFESRRGSYAARNRGLEKATGEVIAFTDADCIPDPDWLERGVARLLAEGPCVLAGRVDAFPKTPGRPNPIELYEIVYGYRQQRSVERVQACFTANVLAQRSLVDDAGPFNDSFVSGGDFEWSRRAFSRGYPVVYADDVRVKTPARRSVRSLVRRSARLAGGGFALQQYRNAGASWLTVTDRPKMSRWDDFQNLLAYRDASLRQKLMTLPVAALVRVVFKAERLRLRLGGRGLR